MSEVALPPESPARPRVAVIVPAYGVAHLVGEALASVQAQTFQDWECVVIDDGAPDDVAGAVAPFLSDPRICFLATANQGVGDDLSAGGADAGVDRRSGKRAQPGTDKAVAELAALYHGDGACHH